MRMPPMWGMMMYRPGMPIFLKAGKAKPPASDDRTAVRVRSSDMARQMGGQAPEGTLTVGLEINPEPRIELRGIKEARIDKAVDDQDQTLRVHKDAAAAAPGGPPGGIGIAGPGAGPMVQIAMMGMPYTQVHLKAGEKKSKVLKELRGVITASFMAEGQPDVTVKDILNAAGKTVKGNQGRTIKVLEVKDKDSSVVIRVELAGGMPGMFGPMPVPAGGAPALPAVPRAAPAPPLPPGGAAPPGGAPRQAALAAQAAQPAQPVPAQPLQAVPGGAAQPPRPPLGGAMGGMTFPEGFMGLYLRDDKGNSLPIRITLRPRVMANPGPPVFELEMTLERQKGQAKPSKLILAGQKTVVDVDIPFSLTDVALP
jgi:hypothetical protein